MGWVYVEFFNGYLPFKFCVLCLKRTLLWVECVPPVNRAPVQG